MGDLFHSTEFFDSIKVIEKIFFIKKKRAFILWNHTKKQFIEVNLDNFVIKSYLNPKDLSVREQKYTYRKKSNQ